MEALAGSGSRRSQEDLAKVLNRYNGLVHGDPASALHGAILIEEGKPGFTTGKDLRSPSRADDVCWETAGWVVILEGYCRLLFPAV